jgi:hypothetical protein
LTVSGPAFVDVRIVDLGEADTVGFWSGFMERGRDYNDTRRRRGFKEREKPVCEMEVLYVCLGDILK